MSNCMPSTSSSVVSVVLPSSTVMTPSLPTFSIASASRSPITRSLLALIAPTWAISCLLETFFDILSRCSTAAATAFSMPRRTAIGLLPATMLRVPSRRIARASTVAVVVPSPASDRGLVGHFMDELRAHVLERVFELDFLADGDAVFGDGRAAERFVDDHIAAARAERNGHGVGQLIDAGEHLGPGGVVEHELFGHGYGSYIGLRIVREIANCKMANCKMQIADAVLQLCNLQFLTCNLQLATSD